MQDIEKIISEKYDLDIKNLYPYRDCYIINTQKGKKLIKKSSLTAERILFVHGAKEHLYENGFKNTDRYLCTTDGSPSVCIEEAYYTLSDVLTGVECNFENRPDIIKASTLLASMHRASRGYIPPENSIARNELGKLPVYFMKRLEDIKKLKKLAKKGRSSFDYLFLDYVNYFSDLAESAIETLEGSNYRHHVMKAEKDGGFCHHDFTQYNVTLMQDDVYISNFEYCCFELKVYDLANFIRRKMRKCNWDINEAAIIVNEYRNTESLSDDDMIIMKTILKFPQKFWRVANRYYNSRRSWSERVFISKLQEVIAEIDSHKQFLDRYDLLL